VALEIRMTSHAADPAAWAAALRLRREVLRVPLGLEYSVADMKAETGDTLFSAWDDGVLAGVVMLRVDPPGKAKLRQMAVGETARGRRVGEQLVRALEEHARRMGLSAIGLASRSTAIGFYERLGYVVDSDEFTEVTIPHRHMSKALQG
jgi:ribosomal protein S18 acetylase RimI-like enzyme